MCEGGGFSVEKPPPSRSLPKRRGWGDAGGEAASLREAPLPQTPSPEEWLGIDLAFPPDLCAHARWARVPVSWLYVSAASGRASVDVRSGTFLHHNSMEIHRKFSTKRLLDISQCTAQAVQQSAFFRISLVLRRVFRSLGLLISHYTVYCRIIDRQNKTINFLYPVFTHPKSGYNKTKQPHG